MVVTGQTRKAAKRTRYVGRGPKEAQCGNRRGGSAGELRMY